MMSDALHFVLDPPFDLGVERFGADVAGCQRRTDAYGYQTRILEKRIARPAFTGVMRDGHRGYAGLHGEPRATRLIAAVCAGRRPRAFRENDDREALLQPRPSLFQRLAQRTHAGAAVDRDR